MTAAVRRVASAVLRVRVQPYGDDAVLVDLPDLAAVRVLDDALRTDPPPGTLDVVPAASTVLVRFAVGTDSAALIAHVHAAWSRASTAEPSTAELSLAGPSFAGSQIAAGGSTATGSTAGAATRRPVASDLVEIGVHYDGDDLPGVAARAGLSRDEVVARHTGAAYTVAFGGFMPGFAYLTGVDPMLHVARRDSPRARVPAGAVALAGGFTAVYPAATPGGWQLIGHSDAVLFDPSRDRPALLAPGMRVRFVDLGAPPGVPEVTDGPSGGRP